MRYITAKVGGKEYEFPASSAILYRSQEYSGVPVLDIVLKLKPTTLEFARFAAGLVTAGVEHCENKRIDKSKMKQYMAAVDAGIEIGDVLNIHASILQAMRPDTVPEETPDPNTATENPTPGQASSD